MNFHQQSRFSFFCCFLGYLLTCLSTRGEVDPCFHWVCCLYTYRLGQVNAQIKRSTSPSADWPDQSLLWWSTQTLGQYFISYIQYKQVLGQCGNVNWIFQIPTFFIFALEAILHTGHIYIFFFNEFSDGNSLLPTNKSYSCIILDMESVVANNS